MPTNAQVHGPAIKATFMLAFDNFSTDPSEVATLPEVGNVRYARELIGLLETAGLLVEQDVNGEYTVWQCSNGTYDTRTREMAEAEIDEFLVVGGYTVIQTKAPKTRRTAPASKRNPAGLPLCLCGCGIPGKSDYRPGHDARHAGNLARAVLAGEMTTKQAISGLSMALAAKVIAQVNRGNAKATPKAPKAKADWTPAGEVKIGRWTYPLRTKDGMFQHNTKRDGSGEWVEQA